MKKVKFSQTNRFQMFFFITILCLIGVLTFSLSRILIPFAISYILFLMIRPISIVFYSGGIQKKIFALGVLACLVVIISYPFIQGVHTLTEEAQKIEIYLPKLESYLRIKYAILYDYVEQRFNYKINFNPIDNLVEFAQQSTRSIFVYLPLVLGSLLEWGFIVPLFLFFMFKDGRKFRNQFLKIVPNSIVEKTYFLFHQFNTKFGDYIFAKFVEATIVGFIISLGLAIINFPFAFLLGVIAAITNILPYVGPFLGFVPALVIGLVDQNPNTTLGAMTLLYVVANVIDLALVFPVLVSKIVNLHPIIVVISVILGSQFMGVVGMVISIPLAAFFKLLFIEIYGEVYKPQRW